MAGSSGTSLSSTCVTRTSLWWRCWSGKNAASFCFSVFLLAFQHFSSRVGNLSNIWTVENAGTCVCDHKGHICACFTFCCSVPRCSPYGSSANSQTIIVLSSQRIKKGQSTILEFALAENSSHELHVHLLALFHMLVVANAIKMSTGERELLAPWCLHMLLPV